MKQLIWIMLGIFMVSNIAYAIPIPALIIGTDFLFFLIPMVIGLFTTIFFYFKKYIFKLNLVLLTISIALYSLHYLVTRELLIIAHEYIIFFIFFIGLFCTYKYKKLFILNYLIIFFLICLVTFFSFIDYKILKYKNYISKFTNTIGTEKIDSYIIRDNFFAIYLKEKGKEIVVSNCYQGQGPGNLLLRSYSKDSDKQALGNGYCVYGKYGDLEFDNMMKIISN